MDRQTDTQRARRSQRPLFNTRKFGLKKLFQKWKGNSAETVLIMVVSTHVTWIRTLDFDKQQRIEVGAVALCGRRTVLVPEVRCVHAKAIPEIKYHKHSSFSSILGTLT
jgi:hypothetical protein